MGQPNRQRTSYQRKDEHTLHLWGLRTYHRDDEPLVLRELVGPVHAVQVEGLLECDDMQRLSTGFIMMYPAWLNDEKSEQVFALHLHDAVLRELERLELAWSVDVIECTKDAEPHTRPLLHVCATFTRT